MSYAFPSEASLYSIVANVGEMLKASILANVVNGGPSEASLHTFVNVNYCQRLADVDSLRSGLLSS